jgi:hypothetical protein
MHGPSICGYFLAMKYIETGIPAYSPKFSSRIQVLLYYYSIAIIDA